MKTRKIIFILIAILCFAGLSTQDAHANDKGIAWVSDGHGMYDAVYNNGKGPESGLGFGPAPITKSQYEAMKGKKCTNTFNHFNKNLNAGKNSINPVTVKQIEKAKKEVKHHKKVLKQRKIKKQRDRKLNRIHGLLLITGGIAIICVLTAWSIDYYKRKQFGKHFKN